MSASPSSRPGRRGWTAVPALLVLVLLAGCQSTPPPRGATPLLVPVPAEIRRPPTEVDRAVAQLAEAALASDRAGMQLALARVETLHDRSERQRLEAEGLAPMKGLVPLCKDLVNSTLDDPVAYRRASKILQTDWRVDPALEARLDRALADDPLRLAWMRTIDHWETLWARTFNMVTEPIGGSLLTGVALAPFKLASSAARYFAKMAAEPAMTVQERQALAHRKRFVAAHPESEEAPKVMKLILRDQDELDEMMADDYANRAERALGNGAFRMAELTAQRALLFDPGLEDAIEARDEARKGQSLQDLLRQRAESFHAQLPVDLQPGGPLAPRADGSPSRARSLLERLMATSPDPRDKNVLRDLVRELEWIRADAPDGPLADEASYVIALLQRDLGYPSESWEILRVLALGDDARSNMPRHAEALLTDPWQNTHGNFVRQQARSTSKLVAFRLFGGYAERSQDLGDLGGIARLAFQIPSIVQTVATAPLRLFFGPWEPPGRDYRRAPAIAGYRYLEREPGGEHVVHVARWLYDYEERRENWTGALKLVDLLPDVDPFGRMLIVEKAASQQFAAAERAQRRDWKGSILRNVVRNFPDAQAGYEAGLALRTELEELSPQRIRITRGFFEENPNVAGEWGLGLSESLLDENVKNGELHPEGVTFLGGQVLEFALIAESGDVDDDPALVRKRVSSERLARAVALLDETVLKNDQLDPADAFTPDAYRDHYLERARLGLAEKPDLRPSAQSEYVYESFRERYGMVRGRDSILPFDLVFQGSLVDLSLGAFPRWREPKKTPDAFLYK